MSNPVVWSALDSIVDACEEDAVIGINDDSELSLAGLHDKLWPKPRAPETSLEPHSPSALST